MKRRNSMRWKTAETYGDRDTRVKTIFAWIPTEIGDTTYWLERVKVKQVLIVDPRFDTESWCNLELYVPDEAELRHYD